MKNFLSCTKVAIVILVVTLISLGFYAYMLARPRSYGMGYYNETEYDGGIFKGTITYNSDGTMSIVNTNFVGEMQYRYYYKNGYVFSLVAETDAEYEEEIEYINNNFDEAVDAPFYASEINAFKQISSEMDGYSAVYTCTSAVVFAIVFGVLELLLIALTSISIVFVMKAKRENNSNT